jgi:hypothetical protein
MSENREIHHTQRTASVVGKSDSQINGFDLFGKEIHFVEENDHGSVDEPLAIANLFEQLERLVHAIRFAVFVQRQIVLG